MPIRAIRWKGGPSYVESLTSDSHPIKDDRWTRAELMNSLPFPCAADVKLSPLSLTVRRNGNGVYTADEACYVSPANLDTIAVLIYATVKHSFFSRNALNAFTRMD